MDKPVKRQLPAEVIQKAWTDKEFKAKLLADPKTALTQAKELDLAGVPEVKIVENTSNNEGRRLSCR